MGSVYDEGWEDGRRHRGKSVSPPLIHRLTRSVSRATHPVGRCSETAGATRVMTSRMVWASASVTRDAKCRSTLAKWTSAVWCEMSCPASVRMIRVARRSRGSGIRLSQPAPFEPVDDGGEPGLAYVHVLGQIGHANAVAAGFDDVHEHVIGGHVDACRLAQFLIHDPQRQPPVHDHRRPPRVALHAHRFLFLEHWYLTFSLIMFYFALSDIKLSDVVLSALE